MIRGVIFDMDGLMFDTERLSTEGWLKAAEETKAPLTVPFIKSFKGTSIAYSKALFQQTFGDTVDYDVCRAIRTDYVNSWIREHGVPIKKGLLTLLNYLKEHQIPAAVATSTRKDLAQMHLEDAGITDYFTAFVYGSEIKNSKPAPDIFLAAAQALKIPPEECLVLEDSPAGIAAGKAAGSVVGAVPDQIELSDELLSGVYCLTDLGAVCSLLEDLNHRTAVFSDVDGTLLTSDHQISPLTCQALRKLEQKGIPLIIASGRGPGGIEPILEEYQLQASMICFSGALVVDEKKQVLFHQGFSKAQTETILQFIEEKKLDLSWILYSLWQWTVKDRSDPRIIREESIVHGTAETGGISAIRDEKINKVLCICNPDRILEIEEILKARFPEYSILKSSEILLEIMPKGTDKAPAAEYFCKVRGIDPKDAYAFGDHYNDEQMLLRIGHGFLMKNAPDPLKQLISRQTEDHDHDGIANALLREGLLI